MTEAGYRLFRRITEHAHAPRWNFETGDRIVAEDLEAVEAFRDRVRGPRHDGDGPPGVVLDALERLRDTVPLLREHLPVGFDLARDWAHVPTTSREDLASGVDRCIPDDADLERLIVYDTSGTTGHALIVPHHPRAVGLLHPLVEEALAWHGVTLPTGPEHVAVANLCAQARTYVFANVFTVWDQAGFAKVNLREDDWAGGADSARAFLDDLAPALITADPITLAEALRWELPVRPRAVLSTAVALEPAFARAVREAWDCPVLDWYSTTETGPIACAIPDDPGALRVIAPDLHVEAVDDEGLPVGPDDVGELTVSGGRNPYLPLLRYRTGDRGRVTVEPGPDGRPIRFVRDFQGRAAVSFRAADDSVVNPVDIGRMLRLCGLFVQHQFVQASDGACTLRVRPAPGVPVDTTAMERGLRDLFGPAVPITVRIEPDLGASGKIATWISGPT